MVIPLLALTLIQVLDRAHSHNDYEQARPLQEALDNGFASVEADVFLVDGKLLVGHDRKELKPERTLDSLYLKPLAERAKANRGWIYPGHVLWVLVDIKADGVAVYEAFKKEIAPYPSLKKAVRFVISGDRPVDAIVKDKGKFAGLDGRWPEMDKGYSKELMPWVSEDWSDHFKWQGQGSLSRGEEVELKAMVEKAHAQNRKIRFWGAPDTETIWETQWNMGVDWINTDHLSALRTWMLERK